MDHVFMHDDQISTSSIWLVCQDQGVGQLYGLHGLHRTLRESAFQFEN